MATDDLKIKGFIPNWPEKDWWESYEGTRYTEASPADKKKHLQASSKRLLEAGYDWREVDAIIRNEARTREAIKLLQDSGAKLAGNQWNLAGVNTPEKEEMFNRAWMITDNLNVLEGRTKFPMKQKGLSFSSFTDPEFWDAMGGTAIDVGRDVRNLGLDTAKFFSWGMPGANYFLPEYLESLKYKDPEGDVLWPIDGGGWDWAKEAGNEFFPPSEVDEFSPYKDLASEARLTGNVIPFGASILFGGKGLNYLLPKLPNLMQKTIKQVFPKLSGQGTFLPKKKIGKMVEEPWGKTPEKTSWFNRNWNPFTKDPSTYRNWALAGITHPSLVTNFANASQIEPMSISDSWDRDPVVFDSYMQNKLANFEPRPKDPGPRDNYRGL